MTRNINADKDTQFLAHLSEYHPLNVLLYQDEGSKNLHVRLYQWQKRIPLSDVLPMLENFNLRVDTEVSTEVQDDKQPVWISDFSVVYAKESQLDASHTHGATDINKSNELFQEAFIKVYSGLSENDGFNKLILSASLSWREVMILRTYAKYLRQVGFRFSQPYIEKTLINNIGLTKDLINLFITLHQPPLTEKNQKQATDIEAHILETLGNVTSLDEDRIIRRLLDLIKHTLRTNYFQLDDNKNPKNYLAIKLNSRKIPELPLPVPMFEIFVYAPDFEAIHLRNAKVARGGIRWSERPEDFRTEILGLMKAQVVKNSVIVPSGAKGGFVLKQLPVDATREVLQQEVVKCYKAFIHGLLDLTDNIKNKKFVKPKNVVCYDKPDPYLVVAADKGTASFSDIANSISEEYDFWLGDAFASGGSTGYDHKKMGITAKGAWESIKRHFRELNIDINNSDITMVGIGDMSGDVFGNGLMYSNHIKLIAAFDHRHIFVDPDPDPETSYYERVRLFNLPTSSWESYNAKLISKGGGVFKRSLKSITLTPQMKKALGTEVDTATPNELIRIALKAPVDLLFNGGIGTYVKASSESQAEVGDRTNEFCRINGIELRCKAVGEGGNLGFTQLGRVEYALNGGLINTDFIDNSAGVDCSDHEVNLKILLDNEVKSDKLTMKKRNELLASLTDEVAELVLKDNYYQALLMSFSAFHANKNIGLHIDYIRELESQHKINRAVEFLPTEKVLIERKTAGLGLTRPELAVLLAYTKIDLKKEILKTTLTEDPYLRELVETAFPPAVRKKYQKAMTDHRLENDIIATQLSNRLINEMGITFIYRLQIETGASIEEIIRAHTVASHIFGTRELQKLVQTLDFKVSMADQYNMLYFARNLINLATRWFLHGKRLQGDLHTLINHYEPRIAKLEKLIPQLMSGLTRSYLDELIASFMQAGLPREIAVRIATYRAMYTSLNIIEVATSNNFDLEKTAAVYFAAGERVKLVWFRDQLASDARPGHWNTLARLNLRDELDIAQRALTIAIICFNTKEKNATNLINSWFEKNQRLLNRWDKFLAMITSSNSTEYAMFFIAMRELLSLIIASSDARVLQ